MHTAVTALGINEPQIDTEAQPEEMESKPQSNGFGIAGLVISILSLIIGVMGGLLVSVARDADRMARLETRIQQVEDRNKEDRETWGYIRTQNETMRSTLAKIEQRLDNDRRR